MKNLLKLIASIAYKYAKEGAGMPSYRGTHEAEVPRVLVKQFEHKEN